MKADRASVLVAAEPLERRLALAVAAFADSPVTINPVGGTIPIAVSPPMLSGDALFAQAAKTVADNVAGKPAAEVESYAGSLAGSLAIMQRTLLERLGKSGRDQLVASHSASLGWLLGDRDAIQMLLSSGDAAGGRWADAGRIFLRIVDGDARAKSGIPLRIAVATALTFAEPVISFADKKPIDPLPRYQAYRDWDAAGQLFSSFRSLTAWEMRYVVGSWARESELVWARSAIRRDLKSRDRVSDAAFMVPYTEFNKRGVSIQDEKNFYDSKPITMALLLEYGAVCGGISKFGTAMCQAFGVPAMPVGQPGHCAFIWQKEPHQWSLNNDISGWAESGRHTGIQTAWGNPAWLVPMMQAAQMNASAYLDAQTLLDATAIAWGKPADDLAVLAEATKRCPLHLAAWRARAALIVQSKQSTSLAKKALKEAASVLATQPMAYAEIALALHPVAAPEAASTAARTWFLARIDEIATMAASGTDATLCSMATTTLLERAATAMTAKGAAAARSIVRGDAAPGGTPTITASEVKSIAELCMDGINRLDGPSGSRHAAWRQATQRMVAGLVAQPIERDRSLARFESQVTGLAASNRTDDARWLADRLVDACKATKDAELEAKAVALRTSLG